MVLELLTTSWPLLSIFSGTLTGSCIHFTRLLKVSGTKLVDGGKSFSRTKFLFRSRFSVTCMSFSGFSGTFLRDMVTEMGISGTLTQPTSVDFLSGKVEI